MRVYCRFAPPCDTEAHPSRPVHISVDKNTTNAAQQKQNRVRGDEHVSTVTVGDPFTGSCASLSCNDIFLPDDVCKNNQNMVFKTVAEPIVNDVLRGRCCALLAYGQTSTGKTHTMFGPDGGNVKYFYSVDQRGIVPRMAEALFDPSVKTVTAVEMRYFELYNETATDLIAKLLQSPSPSLTQELCHAQVVQHDERSLTSKTSGGPSSTPSSVFDSLQVVYKSTEKQRLLRSLQHVSLRNSEDFLQVIGELSALRHVAGTENNAKSSRSHVVIQLHVHLKDVNLGIGQLTMVDLAGSECLKAAANAVPPHHCLGMSGSYVPASTFDLYDAHGMTKEKHNQRRTIEMRNINTSLFTLKKVVHALTTRQEHVPVKESMLTVVLEEPLQSSSAALVVCCSVQHQDLQETLATLRLGSEAAQIPSLSTNESRSLMVQRHQQLQTKHNKHLLHGSTSRYEGATARPPSWRLHHDVSWDGGPDQTTTTENDDRHDDAELPATATKTNGSFSAGVTMSDVPLPLLDVVRSESVAPLAIRTVTDLLNAAASSSRSTSCGSSVNTNRYANERTTATLAATDDVDKDAIIRTLKHQLARLAEAYDVAVVELDEAKRENQNHLKEIHRLHMQSMILKNERTLSIGRSHDGGWPVAERSCTTTAPAVCPPSPILSAPQTPTRSCAPSSLSRPAAGEAKNSMHAIKTFGEDCTNLTEASSRDRRQRKPVVQVFTPSSERYMVSEVGGETGPVHLDSMSMVRV